MARVRARTRGVPGRQRRRPQPLLAGSGRDRRDIAPATGRGGRCASLPGGGRGRAAQEYDPVAARISGAARAAPFLPAGDRGWCFAARPRSIPKRLCRSARAEWPARRGGDPHRALASGADACALSRRHDAGLPLDEGGLRPRGAGSDGERRAGSDRAYRAVHRISRRRRCGLVRPLRSRVDCRSDGRFARRRAPRALRGTRPCGRSGT